MGIKVEFNPDLCLRNYSEYENGNRKIEEVIPKKLEKGKTYPFLKKDQRNYWLIGEIPLRETKGSEALSKPKASVIILEATHFLENGIMYTKGKYKIIQVLDEKTVYFDGFEKIR